MEILFRFQLNYSSGFVFMFIFNVILKLEAMDEPCRVDLTFNNQKNISEPYFKFEKNTFASVNLE